MNPSAKEILKRCAVAVRFDEDEQYKPKVTTTARGHLAEWLIQTAEKNDIPIREDQQLAEGLQFLESHQSIPALYYPLLAELVCHIDQISKKIAEDRS